MMDYKPLFPYFGGKSNIAEIVWQSLGDVRNYVEPFFGSGAVLFLRPPWHTGYIETVNDVDAMICNFWRAVKADKDAVALHADWPVNETELNARHRWLVEQKDSLAAALEAAPTYCDPEIAGWWAWGISQWIGSGWCSSVWRQRPQLANAGKGVHRKLPHLNAGKGVHRPGAGLADEIAKFRDRLRRVRVCCGNWTRVCTTGVLNHNGLAGVFLDPPYSAEAGRKNTLYAEESLTVAHDCRRWALENGDDPQKRIVLCGYENEHGDEMRAAGWRAHAWKASGGYANHGTPGQANRHNERLWLSPHCLEPRKQIELFKAAT